MSHRLGFLPKHEVLLRAWYSLSDNDCGDEVATSLGLYWVFLGYLVLVHADMLGGLAKRAIVDAAVNKSSP